MPDANNSDRASRAGTNPSANDSDFTDVDFEEMLVARKREVRADLERLGLDRGLGAEKQDRLADIVLRLSAAYGQWGNYPQAEKWLRIDRKSGNGQRRKFKRKVKKALAAVDDALQYASQFNSGADSIGPFRVNILTAARFGAVGKS